jgi:hypothetical protein
MAYCITMLSYVPQYSPLFEPINEDGTRFNRTKVAEGATIQYLKGLRNGYRLDESTDPPLNSIPRRAILKGSHKSLPEIFHVGSEICVVASIKNSIEFNEPNVHQFIPIILFRTKRNVFEGDYYLLNICRVLDSVVLSKSNLRTVPTGSSTTLFHVTRGLDPIDYRTLKSNTKNEAHLWRERIFMEDVYISDTLRNCYKQNKLHGIAEHRMVKVSEINCIV